MPSSQNLHQVLTVLQMQAAEQVLMDVGVCVHTLMQRAGNGAAEWVWRASGGQPVTVLCGPGNNGGDGYVIAQHLAERGSTVNLIAPLLPKTEAAKQASSYFTGRAMLKDMGLEGHVFVDCLFGSGLSRPLSAEHTQLISGLQQRHTLSFAVDVPSGVDADTATWPEGLAPYSMTLALGAWKRAHWAGKAAAYSGNTRLIDIGIAEQGTVKLFLCGDLAQTGMGRAQI